MRKYYDFTDVDTDRYTIDGDAAPGHAVGRELALEQNPSATGWVNQRIIYTHGIGVAMVPVNEVTNEGQPRLFIGNLPPVSTGGAPTITQPRIYFGERPARLRRRRRAAGRVRLPDRRERRTAADRHDDALDRDDRHQARHTLMRLLFALRFRDLDLLISDQITGEQPAAVPPLAERPAGAHRAVPALRQGPVPRHRRRRPARLHPGRLHDVSDRFPNAQAFDPGALGRRPASAARPFNYIRNSVKITMDAYDGTMHFYVATRTTRSSAPTQGVFPTLFEPMSAMPADLRAHLRVPEELFNVQTRMFGRYHVTERPAVLPQRRPVDGPDRARPASRPCRPRPTTWSCACPASRRREFLLLQPMVPTGRPNMIAWVAARNDAPNYGATRVYRFPADTTIFGPAQIEARIDQDPIISAADLAVEPVRQQGHPRQPDRRAARRFAASTSSRSTSSRPASAFPEFQRIVVASPRNVVWAPTLGEALDLLLAAEAGTAAPTPSPTPGPTPDARARRRPRRRRRRPGPAEPLPTDVAGLIDYANDHFDAGPGGAARRRLRHATATEIALVQAALAAARRAGARARAPVARRVAPAPPRERGAALIGRAAGDARPPGDLAPRAGGVPGPRRASCSFLVPILVLPTPVGLGERRSARRSSTSSSAGCRSVSSR